MAWVEGFTNSQRILFTLSNILTSSNKVLEKRWRKTVDGKAVDFVLHEEGSNIWKDESSVVVSITDYTEVWVPGLKVDTSKNWQVVYATGGSTDIAQMELNLTNLTKWETFNGFEAKRVILKTTTTPVIVNNMQDEYNTDPDSKAASIDMFLELVQYKNAINPETFYEYTPDPVTSGQLLLRNNHYIELRYCDKMVVEDEYIVDVATSTKKEAMAAVNGVICTVSTDPQTEQPIYTPVSDIDKKLYKIVTIYGNTFLDKANGGHPSEPAKLSWYLDYKEQLIDELDGGPSSDDVSKGIRLMPQIISGMSETIPIQFWINCNNDRISMVLMGDPTIDYDKYLTSFCYIGKIDSFEGADVVNDTAGNFALTCGSSTLPVRKPTMLTEPMNQKVEVLEITSSNNNIVEIVTADDLGVSTRASKLLPTGRYMGGYWLTSEPPTDATAATYATPPGVIQYVTRNRVGYKFKAFSSDDETVPSNSVDFVYYDKYVSDQGKVGTTDRTGSAGSYSYSWSTRPSKCTVDSVSASTYSFKLKLPKNTKKLVAYKTQRFTTSSTSANPVDFIYGAQSGATDLYQIETIDISTASSAVDKGTYIEYTFIENKIDNAVTVVDTGLMQLVKPVAANQELSVIRDEVLGFIQEVKFPITWGEQTTATGVNDIAMFKTRSGVYNQRHYSSFITPEEYMRKDAFNPSRWTGKFHLSPTYIVHGYDGYRGWLKDTVIVDNTSIVHLDELIVNKDSKDKTKPQEIYKYFKLNAPFSFLNNSPNFNYGVGILKSRNYIDDNGNKIEVHK